MDVSVVIPCYNREASIGPAIESALGQSLAPIEIIVVDDGSEDRSAEVARDYGEPVRVLQTANRGASAARNLGIRETRASWIAFLDSDDRWHPDKLAKQAEAVAVFPGVDVVFCDTRALRGGSVSVPSRFALGGVREASVERRGASLRFDRGLFPFLLTQSRLFTSAVMVRASIPGLAFREDLRRAEDWALWLELSLEHSFAAVDEVLVDMYYADDNLSSATAQTLTDGLQVLLALAGSPDLQEHERQVVEEALQRKKMGALYHSMQEGQGSLARSLLLQVERREIGLRRWWSYWLLTRLPDSILRWLAAIRSAAATPS